MLKPQQTVVLYGSATDPEVQESVRKIKTTGRKVKVEARPPFDSGLGPCGKKQCNCKTPCDVAYPGDQGPRMGHSY